MRVWEVQENWGIDHLRQVDRADPPPPGPGEVAVRMRAAAVNYRDLSTVLNRAHFGKLPQIPFSDAAGEVIEVGAGVIRFKTGDRVCPRFFPDWLDGPPTGANRARSLGSASAPGVLQEVMVLGVNEVSSYTPHLSPIEAATLPCAGLTAWR